MTAQGGCALAGMALRSLINLSRGSHGNGLKAVACRSQCNCIEGIWGYKLFDWEVRGSPTCSWNQVGVEAYYMPLQTVFLCLPYAQFYSIVIAIYTVHCTNLGLSAPAD